MKNKLSLLWSDAKVEPVGVLAVLKLATVAALCQALWSQYKSTRAPFLAAVMWLISFSMFSNASPARYARLGPARGGARAGSSFCRVASGNIGPFVVLY